MADRSRSRRYTAQHLSPVLSITFLRSTPQQSALRIQVNWPTTLCPSLPLHASTFAFPRTDSLATSHDRRGFRMHPLWQPAGLSAFLYCHCVCRCSSPSYSSATACMCGTTLQSTWLARLSAVCQISIDTRECNRKHKFCQKGRQQVEFAGEHVVNVNSAQSS